MAAKQKNIFTRSKPLMKIYSGVDDEGKEVNKRLLNSVNVNVTHRERSKLL